MQVYRPVSIIGSSSVAWGHGLSHGHFDDLSSCLCGRDARPGYSGAVYMEQPLRGTRSVAATLVPCAPNALYELRVDRNEDLVADVTYLVRFGRVSHQVATVG